MVRNLDLKSLNRFAPVAAAIAGAVVALLVAVLPSWRLEALVGASGLADHLAAARPPLGATARSALALASGGGVALAVWTGLTLVARRVAPLPAEPDAPVLRRADAHPDAPARRPLRASEDLGLPIAEEEKPVVGKPLRLSRLDAPAIVPPIGERLSPPREVPADLDTTLAAVDPCAIPDVPREPIRPVSALTRSDAEERIETFELTPIRRAVASAPRPAPATQPASAGNSLAVLLDRLEQSSARRAVRPAPPLAETIGILRGLAPREI